MAFNIDWEKIHRRMVSVQAAIEKGLSPGSEEKKRILRERAKTLARETEIGAAEEEISVVEFLAASERYGIELIYASEVYPLRELTVIPCTPSFILGVINVRGRITPVIDIKRFFDLPEKGLTDLNKVVIVHYDSMELGLLADMILGVRSVPVEDIQPALPTLTEIRAEYLKGVTKERLVILDAEKLLSDRKLVVNESVGSGQSAVGSQQSTAGNKKPTVF